MLIRGNFLADQKNEAQTCVFQGRLSNKNIFEHLEAHLVVKQSTVFKCQLLVERGIVKHLKR